MYLTASPENINPEELEASPNPGLLAIGIEYDDTTGEYRPGQWIVEAVEENGRCLFCLCAPVLPCGGVDFSAADLTDPKCINSAIFEATRGAVILDTPPGSWAAIWLGTPNRRGLLSQFSDEMAKRRTA